MKKIITIVLILILTLSASACSPAALPDYTANWGKSDVEEISKYNITVKDGESIFTGAPEVTGEGTFLVTITGDYKKGYTMETSLDFEGEFVLEGGNKPFVQKITSSVTFTDVTGNLAPSSSEKSYVGSTIAYKGTTGEFSIEPLEYTSTVDYVDEKAIVKIDSKYPLPANIKAENTISLPTTYYDNEQILLFGRSFLKSLNSQVAFSVVSPFSNDIVQMALNVSGEATLDMTINEEKESLKAHVVAMGKSGSSETGSAFALYYGKDDKGMVNGSSGNPIETDRSRLLKMEQLIPYTSSSFVFELVEFQSKVTEK